MKYIKIILKDNKILEDIDIRNLTLQESALFIMKLEEIKYLLIKKRFEFDLEISEEGE